MNADFNIEEIFEMAEQIERNGARFYRSAAETVDKPEEKTFLMDLAEREDEHDEVFQTLRAALTVNYKDNSAYDPGSESIQYLRVLADARVFFDKDINTSSMEAILKSAILIEKDSIAFYLGLKDVITEKRDKNTIDTIINEEMQHIRLLGTELLAATSAG